MGGPSVAETAKPSKTATAANRMENPFTPYLKLISSIIKKIATDYARFMNNVRLGQELLLAHSQRSVRM